MKIRACFFASLLTISLSPAFAENSKAAEKVEMLDKIQIFANQMCEAVPLNGKKEQFGLSADIRAKLKGIIKAAADAGFGAAVKYGDDEYSGLLQKDLVVAQQNRNACRKSIFDALNEKLLGSVEKSESSSRKPSNPKPPTVSVTFDDFYFDAKSNTLSLRSVFNNAGNENLTITSIAFGAKEREQDGVALIDQRSWKPLILPPHAALPYDFSVSLSAERLDEVFENRNLPKYLFLITRTVNSTGNVRESMKHFMTLRYTDNMALLGTLYSDPIPILDRASSIYSMNSKVSFTTKGLISREQVPFSQ